MDFKNSETCKKLHIIASIYVFFYFALKSNTAAFREAYLKAFKLVKSKKHWSNLLSLPVSCSAEGLEINILKLRSTELTSVSLCAINVSSRTMTPLLSCRVFLRSTILALKLSHFSISSFLAFTTRLCSLKCVKFCVSKILGSG